MNYGTEFKKYAMSDHNVSSSKLNYYEKQIENSMTPYILEEREMRATQIDIFSRLMADRLLWVAGPVNDGMSTVVQAQLMFLDSVDKKDITMHIDSPGGSVKSGLSMVDVMDYIKSEGKRSSLRHSTTMLHQSSGGFSGNIQDAEIDMKEWKKVNDILFKLLGEYCGKTAKQVAKDATRDFWLNSEEAVKYGIIDEIIGVK